ncbi:MAG: putative regulator of Ras-like GTPase [Candidatus Alkanophagales archaeon MCA70_species_2]|nr:putative regulator of Ras-like GTPase [Candidatus Alkanophaga liquidiphilum]
MTLKEELENILAEIKNIGGIEASAIVSRDGLLIVGDMGSDVHAETFAAMSAAMLGAAETAVAELKKGLTERVIVESQHGRIIATGAGPRALLVVMAAPDAGLGLILVGMRKAAEKIMELLK